MDALTATVRPAPSFEEFWSHCRAGRWKASWTFVSILAAAMLVAALVPPSYRATATLAVLPSPEFTVRGAVGAHDPNTTALAMDQIMKAETAILDSADLHEATIRTVGGPKIYRDIFAPKPTGTVGAFLRDAARLLLSPWRPVPVDLVAFREETALRAFESDLDLLPTKDANVITVTFNNENGDIAAQTVNVLLGLYSARRARLYDDPQIAVVKLAVQADAAAVANADERLAVFKLDHGISDYTLQRQTLLRRRSEAEQGIAVSAEAKSEQLARLLALTRALREEPAMIGIYKEKDADTRLQSVNAGLQDLRTKLAAARDKYLDSSRVVTMLQSQLRAEEGEASRLGTDPSASVVRQGRNPNIEALRLDRARAVVELAAADARMRAEQGQAEGAQAALDRLDRAELGLDALQRDKATAEDNFATANRLLAERNLREAEDRLRLANVRVIQPALVPQRPRPLPWLIIAAGAVFGALTAIARLIGDFVLKPVFLTAEGLELATGLPVLAVFAQDFGAGKSKLAV